MIKQSLNLKFHGGWGEAGEEGGKEARSGEKVRAIFKQKCELAAMVITRRRKINDYYDLITGGAKVLKHLFAMSTAVCQYLSGTTDGRND